MSNRPLQEKIQKLQCHFTWQFEKQDKIDVAHTLKKVAFQIAHTPYHNRGTFITMKAYLHQLQGAYDEALRSLQEAEVALKQDHSSNISCQILVTYGNYAWIYYHLSNYDMVEFYLDKILSICQSLFSPQPYSVLIPEIYAQKGWSLLAVGFRNGEEAKECFRMALKGDKCNKEFQAGLAFSIFASWTHSWRTDIWKEAMRLMEEVVHHHSQNAEAKVYLARLLQRKDIQRALSLVEDVIQSSLNPEVLRNAAKVYEPQSLSQAITILQKAIVLDPSYHLLHYDLGICYKKQMMKASPEERKEILQAAIESFKQAIETNSPSVFGRLNLAKMYGEKSPAFEEEIYQNLVGELPNVTKRCQQAIYLHWGDFLLHKKGLKHEALEMYKAGFAILDVHNWEQQQLKERLMNLATTFQEESKINTA
ncbi:interferon-induced protein with tetratricopeptide repeats 5-like [Tiliqua scincoides]|uniref:interferon-induced protein with tetratricopeptide repeats 5-like n=1 Tax=Tiliqua scincoides TaxID=71010 RepID=UPI003461F911